ncbi:hypothetical protein A3Q56_01298 [Intoshia linei]|uniref:polo kinase n=1 Tax=Intoshia linei TaxID=1819745 RepID=A0A177B9C6_9BILA|nr:hypothetical protein A3Q56_01298 [Intoshia linei]
MSSKEGSKHNDLPPIIVDKQNRKKYSKGQFMGKGGFAKCYEMTDMDTGLIYAGKIISRRLLTKQSQKDKAKIRIHKSVHHDNIVQFYGNFEDANNVYILLELCKRRSLMEMHRRRNAITEPEARYFMFQIVTAVAYLHENCLIHRDLKLGNLFINHKMEIKIGDFGLATDVKFNGERKKTLCGTPNYIAPEVLLKHGHSYEVDAWSLGCILYTLLIGKPPFETPNIKETYAKIKHNDYDIPKTKVSTSAANLIRRLLDPNPRSRPSMREVLKDPFFKSGYMPDGLPQSALSVAPRFDDREFRKPLNLYQEKEVHLVESDDDESLPDKKFMLYTTTLLAQIDKIYGRITTCTSLRSDDDIQHPASVPIFWISKWVDYSDKYGLGYQLNDNSVGVLFNDNSRVILFDEMTDQIQYIEKNYKEAFYSLSDYPKDLSKKITLLKYFKNYMNDHLLKTGANIEPRKGDELCRLPFLVKWYRTRSAIVLFLSNGTLQINFFQDHTKLIFCPLMQAVSYIRQDRSFKTFPLELLDRYGCTSDFCERFKYAKNLLYTISRGNLKVDNNRYIKFDEGQ